MSLSRRLLLGTSLPAITAGAAQAQQAFTLGGAPGLTSTGLAAGIGSGGGGGGTVYTITTVGSGTWTVPTGVTQATFYAWGGGASAYYQGGGGGAYARKTVSLTPGAVLNLSVGAGGASSQSSSNPGGVTWVSTGTQSSAFVQAAGGTGTTGGQASACIGDVVFSGGNGGLSDNNIGLLGGGGAGGPAGSGGNGGSSTARSPSAGTGGGGGGGGATGGNDTSTPTGGAGGNNYLGSGGGAGGTSSALNGVAGTAGGGGGGGYQGSSTPSIGGNGGNGTEVGNGAGGSGGGGGAGGEVPGSSAGQGGTGGLFGGGGGSGGYADSGSVGGTMGAGGNGGIIIITGGAPATITVNNPGAVAINTAVPISGTLSGYTAAPTLQYATAASGPWTALPSGSTVTSTSFSFTAPAFTYGGPFQIWVRDANNTLNVNTTHSFPAAAMVINAIGTQTVNTAFTVSGGLGFYSTAPTLQYSNNGSTWLALPTGATVTPSNFSFTNPGFSTAGVTSVRVRDANSSSVLAQSNNFTVATNIISVTTIPIQTPTSTFTVSGTLTGYTSAPTLQYSLNNSTWNSLPSGSTVTATTFSFTSPAISTTGNYFMYVRDAGNTNIVGQSYQFLVSNYSGLPEVLGCYAFPNAGQGAGDDGAGFPLYTLGHTGTPSFIMASYAAACGWTGTFIDEVYGVPNNGATGPNGWGEEIANAVTSPAICNLSPAATTPVIPFIGVAQLPTSGSFGNSMMQAIAAGTYDSFYQSCLSPWASLPANSGFPSSWVGKPWPGTIYIRLAYEFNIGSITTPYGIDYAGTYIADWIPMWQHIYTVWHTYAAANGLTISVNWCPTISNNSLMSWDIRSAWPGNAFVDSIGLDIYELIECQDTAASYTNYKPFPNGVNSFADLGAMTASGSQAVYPGYAALQVGSATQLDASSLLQYDTTGFAQIMLGKGNTSVSPADLMYHYLDWPNATQYRGANGGSIQAAGGGSNNIGVCTGTGMMDIIQWAAYCSTNSIGQGGTVGGTGSTSRSFPICFPEFGVWPCTIFYYPSGKAAYDQSPSWAYASSTLDCTSLGPGIYVQMYGSGANLSVVRMPNSIDFPFYMQSRIEYAQRLGVTVANGIWFSANPNAWLSTIPQLGAQCKAIGWAK